MTRPWYDLPTHRLWLQDQTRDLLEFGRNVKHPLGGAAWLDDDGVALVDRAVETWITCRMLHVNSLGMLLGIPGCGTVAQSAIEGLTGVLKDTENGGWFTEVAADGTPAEGKSAYAHAFVLLAATSAVKAGVPGAQDLLDEASTVLVEKFWDEEAGKLKDTWDTAFTNCEDYRGINANMHGVEAMLAAGDVTGDSVWHQRALRVVRFVIEQATAHGWSVPEHYDSEWNPVLDYNTDQRDDPFKPYGITIGHGLEWARLILQLEGSLSNEADREGLLEAAIALFDSASTHGWAVDGEPGFVYTTDWDNTPIVRNRMHWVAAEGIATAAVLSARTGEPIYAQLYATWWDYTDTFLIDHERGSWHHELNVRNEPEAAVWPGKPDIYHALQVSLFPRLPIAPSLATALSEGLLK